MLFRSVLAFMLGVNALPAAANSFHPLVELADTTGFCWCPPDTIVRPGREIDLVHGYGNPTPRNRSVYFSLVGDRWPSPIYVGFDPDYLGPAQSREFRTTLSCARHRPRRRGLRPRLRGR